MYKKLLLVWMCILTFLAGFINAIAIFGYDGTTVSHLTGLISKTTINLAHQDYINWWAVLRVILAFFLGAIISGFVTGERNFYLHKRYGFIIVAIGLLMIVPFFITNENDVILFALVMGMQNGMVVSFKGIVVRMTHMTGNVTDLGVFIGYKLRGNKNEKVITGIIPLLAIANFVLGGLIGITLYALANNYIFFIISGIYLLLGGFYFILRYKCNDKNFNDIPDDLEEQE